MVFAVDLCTQRTMVLLPFLTSAPPSVTRQKFCMIDIQFEVVFELPRGSGQRS